VYDREVAGKRLSFGVSGKLYRNSLIMYDRETETLWSHLLGAAVQGPLRGERLETIPSSFTTWGDWRERHPETLVLSPSASPYGGFGTDPYAGYYDSGRIGVLGQARDDDRLDDKELVLGVMAPAAKAYAFRDLERERTIRDTLAGEMIEVVYRPSARSAEAFLVERGRRERLPATPLFWFAWVDFFPNVPLWRARESQEPQ
jgi:hypothetical protein